MNRVVSEPGDRFVMRCPWPVALLLISLLFPLSISFGPIVLTPTRIVLIGNCLALLPRFLAKRKSAVDLLVLFHSFWVVLSFSATGGIGSGIESGGVYVVELLGAYLATRTLITTLGTALGSIVVVASVVLVLLPFAAIEFLTGRRIITGVMGGPAVATETRYGFYRTHGPFAHPILFGCFCASFFGMFVWGAKAAQKKWSLFFRVSAIAGIFAGAWMGLTSAGLLTLLIQMMLWTWGKVIRIPKKWKILSIGAVLAYVILDSATDRPAYLAVLSRFTFSTQTLYYRTLIFEFGKETVLRNPLFGIGFGDWERPSWMYNDTVDNFWLLTAMRHGIPAVASLALAVCLTIALKPASGNKSITNALLGARISLFGLSLAATTVHLWGGAWVIFAFLLGFSEALRRMPDPPDSPAAELEIKHANLFISHTTQEA